MIKVLQVFINFIRGKQIVYFDSSCIDCFNLQSWTLSRSFEKEELKNFPHFFFNITSLIKKVIIGEFLDSTNVFSSRKCFRITIIRHNVLQNEEKKVYFVRKTFLRIHYKPFRPINHHQTVLIFIKLIKWHCLPRAYKNIVVNNLSINHHV